MVNDFTSRDLYFTTEPESGSPTGDWEQSRALVRKGEEMLRNMPRIGGTSWWGMGPQANRRWENWRRRVESVVERHRTLAEVDTCLGCGQYSEGGRIHNSRCRQEARNPW
ncbi:MAG TPA: hypothetical protein VFR02_03615 [bacterium]|nr:hypothetical protein [bacterium]